MDNLRIHFQNKNWDEIITLCQEMLTNDDGRRSETLYALALALYSKNEYIDAYNTVVAAHEEDPQNAEIANFCAIMAFLVGDHKSAFYYTKLRSIAKPASNLKELISPDFLPDLDQFFTKTVEDPLKLRALHALDNNDIEMAEHWYRQQSMAKPNDPASYINLCMCLLLTGSWRSVMEVARGGMHACPGNPDISVLLAKSLAHLGYHSEARHVYDWAIRYSNTPENIIGEKCLSMFHDAEFDRKKIVSEIIKWGEASSIHDTGHWDVQKPKQKDKLVVAYLVGQLETSRIAPALADFLMHHNHDRFHPIAFGIGEGHELQNYLLQKGFREWRNIKGINIETVRAMIGAEEPDILIDLSGYNEPGLLRLFSMRIAPVQISMIGSPFGTGMPEMDYLVDGIGLEERNIAILEKAIQLKTGNVFIAPMTKQNFRIPKKDQQITFLCDAELGSLSPQIVATWARILNQCPNSTLVLKNNHFLAQDNTDALIQRFGNYGISHRIDIVTTGNMAEFFAHGDIFLASYDQNYITVYNAMECGLPVIYQKGKEGSSYPAHLLFNTLDIKDNFLADDDDQYVEFAINWANSPEKRDFLSKNSAKKYKLENLFNYKARIQEWEDLLEHVWVEKSIAK
ncbi:hypothetical protein GCM10011332_07210 [Terasakiella brassicae]|uniref:O-GlcNAc transferase C-terminal domain-containing protein n=1 Tax=Terasakiella brassicae TaxID=1634917 RepID=A0A917BUF2_9PROT|nr:hypothetical protein [Terasakiella brassicae]GGF56285.1 hypothetical protein GCM10011332_07210 [Terasakiella brassicae]